MFGDAAFADRPLADVECLFGLAIGRDASSATFDYIIYAATREFATNADDSRLPSQPFRGTLDTVLSFRRSILGNDIGTFTTGDGTSQINNADGAYDYLPQTFTADGRPYAVKVIKRGDDTSRAFTLFKGVMASWFIDENSVAIQLRDFGYKLNVPALPNLYGGGGGIDGSADLAQKRKPRGIGRPRNVPAVLLDAAYLIYQVHDGAVTAVSSVYDRGTTLTFQADFLTYAGLQAATITPGNYATCNALGLFRLNGNPAGQVTADFETLIDTTADAVRYFVEGATDLSFSSDFFVPSFENMNAAQPAPVDYWLGPDASETVADVCANLARGIGGWVGFRRSGLLEIQRFLAPRGVSSGIYTRADIIDLKREPLPSGMTPPPYRQRVPYALNWTVQDDLAGSVGASRKAFVASASRLSEASSSSIRADHPFAQDPEPAQAFFRLKQDSDAEARRRLDLYRVEAALYRLTLPRRALAEDIGNEITIQYPRFDLSVGRSAVVVEIAENLQAPRAGQVDTVEVVAYG